MGGDFLECEESHDRFRNPISDHTNVVTSENAKNPSIITHELTNNFFNCYITNLI